MLGTSKKTKHIKYLSNILIVTKILLPDSKLYVVQKLLTCEGLNEYYFIFQR